ncbi:MAG: T9SS type A sorting domain-containing protein [Candidatus Cloacimonetes bacterium]|nr:T9SS type A sorting domain-containing protein [Candidatus Cloacimonadota bacterium]
MKIFNGGRMKKMFGFIVLAIFALSGFAIDVDGSVEGTWQFIDTPHNVVADLIIEEGNTLIIEAGVQIVFTGHYSFDISGIMEANGTADDNIVFSANQDDGWNGLKFIDQTGDIVSNLKHCEITDGIKSGVDSSGGGVFLDNANIHLDHVLIHGNVAGGYGGGIYMYNSDPILDYVDIYNNAANYDGGGFFCFNSSPEITKTLIVENSTLWEGGAFACFDNSNPIISGATISDNSALENGPAIAALYNSTISLVNCIVYENYFGDYLNGFSEIYEANSGTVDAYYCVIRNGEGESYFTDSCFDEDPGFEDPDNMNYQLLGSSPCIDAGNPDSQYNDPDGTYADIGRYFYEQSGIRGMVLLDTEDPDWPEDLGFEDITIEVYQDTLFATSSVNGIGSYYVPLVAGTYSVKCHVDYYLYAATPISVTVTVVDGQLAPISDFMVSKVGEGWAVGNIWIDTVPLDNASLYQSIVISSNAPGSEEVSPYPIYDIFGYIIRWEYKIDLPEGIDWFVTAQLFGFEQVESDPFNIEPYAGTTIDDITLYPQVYPGTITGTVTLKIDPLVVPDPAGNVMNVLVYYDDEIDSGVHPDADGFYSLDVINGYRKVTAVLDEYADAVLYDIFVVSFGITENTDITLVPWVMDTNDQFEMSSFVTTSLNGEFLLGGSGIQLAAFGSDGVCCGIGGWNSGNHPYWCTVLYYYNIPGYWYFTLMSDAQIGEEITFRAYDPSVDEFYDFNNDYTEFYNDTSDDQVYLSDNTISYQQDFDFNIGYNWISFNLQMEENSLDSVFDPIASSIEVIRQNSSSAVFMNGNWYGDFTSVNNDVSYKMSMSEEEVLTVEGSLINPTVYPIYLSHNDSLSYNWNWVSFINPNLEQANLPLDIALASIKDRVISIKNQGSSAFNDIGTWIGDLTEMTIGEGYVIDIGSGASSPYLIYPGIGYYDIRGENASYSPKNLAGWKLIEGNDNNMVLMADIGLTDGFEVGVFDDEGICRSIGKLEGDFWYFTVLGNELDETLHLRGFNTKSGTISSSIDTFNYCANTRLGDPKNPIKFDFEDLNTTQPVTKVSLNQNYPNPFNPVTTFSFSLPNSSDVSLKVFNIKGQLVDTLIDEKRESGVHEITWNATQHGSGVYFYKLSVGNNSPIIKKCIILK